MTIEHAEDNAQKEMLVKYWLEKAHESLESARNEYENGRLSFAVNRIYYACFYALTAVLRDRGSMFKRHKGLRSALHRDLVKNGIVKERWGKFGEPREFFRRTFLTIGLNELLKGALLRLTNRGGGPVVELQTNFGGGKTHSMLALYHLFSDVPANDLAGIERILESTGIVSAPRVCRAALVGTALNPAQPHVKSDGTEIRTLWGKLAWQLGGLEAYGLVAGNDANGTSPGSQVGASDIIPKWGIEKAIITIR